MAEITEDVEVRVAAESDYYRSLKSQNTDVFQAAQNFVESYYSALTKPGAREHLTNFYLTPSQSQKVDINMNGTLIPSPSALQEIFTKQVNKCHYDVQSYDCQVTNKDYAIGRPENLGNTHEKGGRRMSILVTVSGTVKFWGEDGAPGEVRGFSDVVFLVPNWNTFGGKAIKARRWLIQSQTFRLVV